MKKRYIIAKEGVKLLKLKCKDAVSELRKDIVITDTLLVYKHLPFASVVLTDDQVAQLKAAKIDVKEEYTKQGQLLARGDYEKLASNYVKVVKTGFTGKGCKVAIMDTTCQVSIIQPFAAVNLADGTSGVGIGPAHGQYTSSIVKCADIGMANGCELHFLKVITSDNMFNQSAFIAGLDYCIDNNIDVVNMSFSYADPTFLSLIQNLYISNCIIVAAAGDNTSVTTILAPAGENNVIAVNAIAEDGTYPYKNINPYGTHGITVACSGVNCQAIDEIGQLITTNGSSFSAPFFTAAFAIYKEQLGLTDNYAIVQHMLLKCVKQSDSSYAGYGRPTF